MALETIGRERFDAILLDVGLPDMDGRDLCRAMRQAGVTAPIVMLTAADSEGDTVQGLDAGADDYVTKPFDNAELKARMEALLRRAPREERAMVEEGKFGKVTEVRKDGEQVSLAGRELKLLQYLMEHQDRVVSREEILKKVWEYEGDASSRTVDVHVAWLRQKLDDPENPRYIQTVRGKGYRFTGDDTEKHGGRSVHSET